MHECTISGTLGFVLRLSRIYGVAPLRFQRVDKGWRMYTSGGAYIYEIVTLFLTCVYVVALITTTFYRDGYWAYYDRITSMLVSRVISALATIVIMAAHLYCGINRMQAVITCLTQLQKINDELNNYGSSTSYEKIQRYLTIYSLISVHILVVFDSSAFMYRFNINDPVEFYTKTILLILHNIKILITKVLILQIGLILIYVLSSFKHLNNCVNNLTRQLYAEHKSKKLSHQTYKTVNKIGYLYCCLHEVIHVLDRSYGNVMIALIFYFMLHLIRALFILIKKLIEGPTNFDLCIVQFLWVTQQFGDLLIIIEPCQRTRQQIKRTKNLLSELMRFTPSDEHKLMMELEVFYKHVMTNEAVYVPMNMCELNRTVIITVSGFIITYLVIVLQVHY